MLNKKILAFFFCLVFLETFFKKKKMTEFLKGEIFKYSQNDDANVIWLDLSQNQYHFDQFLLSLHSPVFKGINFKEAFQTNLPKEICEIFFKMLYSVNIDTIVIDPELLLALASVFFKYNMDTFFESCVRRLSFQMSRDRIPLYDDNKSLTLINLSNQKWFEKSAHLVECVVYCLYSERNTFPRDILLKLNSYLFKEYFMYAQMRVAISSEYVEYYEKEDKQWYYARILNKGEIHMTIEFYRHEGDIKIFEGRPYIKTINLKDQDDYMNESCTHEILDMKTLKNGDKIFLFKPCIHDEF